jgi:ABC-2 type transport system ATP-binding protein
MDTLIRVNDLTLYYGRHLAVDHIDFEVKAGEILGFLGPNGAGKTTTQRILTGLLPPTKGTAYVLDHDMASDPLGAKKHIGVVPEVANPYPELSGWRNLMFTGELYGLAGRMLKSRAETVLKDFGLWERRDDLARHYSKGMKQRLMLAMALLHHPQVLFLDEPTAGLDVESRRMIHRSVKRLTDDGMGVFYTTHYIEEANMLCDRVAIIRQGRIVASDTPEALKSAFAGSQSVLVSFSTPVEPGAIGPLEGVTHVEKQADKLRLFAESPERVITQVLDFAHSQNLEILSLNTLGPSLEEVFVSLSKGDFSVERSTER